MQPLDSNKLLDILEFGVPASWCREFTVQGFDPVDQGLRKFVEFYTRLESCEPSEDRPNVEKTAKAKTMGKHKAKVSTTTTTTPVDVKYYCKMHGPNRTHSTKGCFELKQRAKHTNANTSCNKADKVTYKDLNAFVNAKLTTALNKANKNQKKKEAKKVTINAFDKCCNLKVDSSDEESNHEVNALAAASDNDSDSNASCVPSKDSDNDNE
eukprot:7974567-Ditylum_brightwellii.AAC.1